MLEEEVVFVPNYGEIKIKQLSLVSQNTSCLATNSLSSDSTGLRTYIGTYVFLQFLHSKKILIDGLDICELGSGVGLCGIAYGRKFDPRTITLTDGSETAVEIGSVNVADHPKMNFAHLMWGMDETYMQDWMLKHNNGNPFHLIFGT